MNRGKRTAMLRWLNSCRTCLIAISIALCASSVHAASLPSLHVDGARIVDSQNRTITLRGINLGGWLVEEIWMMPWQPKPTAGSNLPEVKDHVTLRRVFVKRYGTAGAARVFSALRDSWITDADFDRIKGLGFNCVRLPFLYDLLEEPNGIRWLDRAIDRAAKRGLYTILDMHGTPGRQSNEHHTGEIGPNALFKEEVYILQTIAVWKHLARRYKGRSEVAGYDTMNEPTGARDAKQLYEVQDRLYKAIRSVDPAKIVIIEDGYKGLDTLPAPRERGWTNVVLSTHYYHFDAKNEGDHHTHWDDFAARSAPSLARKGAPYYVGELNLEPHGTGATMAYILSSMNAHGWSWSPWTYKIMMPNGNSSMWGLYRNTKPVKPLDPFRDSESELIKKMDQMRTERLDEHTELAAAYHTAARR